MADPPDARDVAEYMVQALDTGNGELHQQDIVYDIERHFGPEFTYLNENGNPAIKPAVLKEFRKLTEGKVIWVRSERYWRWRTSEDGEGRMSDY